MASLAVTQAGFYRSDMRINGPWHGDAVMTGQTDGDIDMNGLSNYDTRIICLWQTSVH